MNYEREFKIVFEHGGKVWLINIDKRIERFDISNLGLNYEDHNQYLIDEDMITFKTFSGHRGKYEKVQSILIEGKMYSFDARSHSNKAKSSGSEKSRKKPKQGAIAPYNFVPLNKIISKSNNSSDHSVYATDLWSGYFDYDVHNLTDLFIREQGERKDFFGKSLSKERIPGSSMRGLIRTLYEIITYSKIGEIEVHKRFFNRNVGEDTSRYKKRLGDNQRAGWVKRQGRKYFLVDASPVGNGENYVKVAVKSEASEHDDDFQEKIKSKNEVFIEWENLGISEGEYKWDDVFAQIDETSVMKISKQNEKDLKPYVLFQTGHIFSKKHQYLIGSRPSGAKEEDVTNSINLNISDESRSNRYGLFQKLKRKENTWYPCFYIQESFQNENQYLIGETPMFRLPYEREIIDFLPAEHKEDTVDVATKVFGSTNRATQVYFEDAFATSKVEYGRETGVKMLASPKPTAYSHYAQEGMSYDEQTTLRGNKMYWHKSEAKYQLDYSGFNEKKRKQHVQKIKPIEKATFTGRVRFDNLSKPELGALLFIFNLPKRMALKLGLGKPYGMGSIEIKNCRLNIINRTTRYTSIFDAEGSWNTGIDNKNDIDSFIEEFIKMIQGVDVQITSRKNFFKSDRMQHLDALLTYDHQRDDWLDKTRYMTLKEFRKNEILPTSLNI